MKILVTGGGGQLARAIARTWREDEIILLDRHQLDLGKEGDAGKALESHRPDVVVNAGAHTQVDLCESEPDRARLLNATGVSWLAEACADHQCLLIQISTDYVFDGCASRPYREDDPTSPMSVYGRTKLEGEQEALKAPKHLIIRTSWLYDAWGKNFLLTMLSLARQGKALRVVDDQHGAPTSCRALVRQLRQAVKDDWRGLVNATCDGETTWHGFAAAIFEEAGLKVDLSPCSTDEFPRPAKRPAYSVLSPAKRGELGSDVMPHWREGLLEVMGDLEGI